MLLLPTGDGALGLNVVEHIFGFNLLALAGVLALYGGAVALGLMASGPAGLSGAQV